MLPCCKPGLQQILCVFAERSKVWQKLLCCIWPLILHITLSTVAAARSFLCCIFKHAGREEFQGVVTFNHPAAVTESPARASVGPAGPVQFRPLCCFVSSLQDISVTGHPQGSDDRNEVCFRVNAALGPSVQLYSQEEVREDAGWWKRDEDVFQGFGILFRSVCCGFRVFRDREIKKLNPHLVEL